MILEHLLAKNVRHAPDKVAIVEGAMRFTYEDLYQRSNRLANALTALGVKPGSHVAILNKNSHEYIELYFAVTKIRAVAVPVNFRLKEAELAYILNDSEAEIVVVREEFVGVVDSIRAELASVRHFVVIGDMPRKGYRGFEQLLAEASAEAPGCEGDESDIALLMYTSGTTGFPKGALISQRSLMTTLLGALAFVGIARGDVFLSGLPFFHIAVIPTLAVLAAAGTNVILREFSPEEALTLVGREKVNWLLVVPTEIGFLLQHPGKESHDLSSLRRILYGAMPISSTLLREAMGFFRCGFTQVYASTEIGLCCLLEPEDHVTDGGGDGNRKLKSAGRPALLSQVRVVDDQDREVTPGEIGEIIVRGHCVMSGYWKLPEQTAVSMKGGWFHTGDLARMDEEGYLFIVDRKADMIISGGENIYPAEIEGVLCRHPAVRMAAVVGVPDPQWGESVKAIVVLQDGKNVTEAEILAYCGQTLAGYKNPRSIEFVDSLPLNPVGKVMKRVLREKYWQGYDRRVH